MPTSTLVDEITRLVEDAVETSDQALLAQVLHALHLLLAEHSEPAPEL